MTQERAIDSPVYRRVLSLCLVVMVTGASQAALANETAAPAPVALIPTPAETQATSEEHAENPPWVAVATLGGVYVPLTVWSYFAWYHNKPDRPFLVGGDGLFGESTYAGGADKMGHVWINLALSRGTTELLMRGGWNRLPASLLASGMSFAFFAFIEVKDGFYYELSYGDLFGNGLGAVASAVMVNFPRVDELVDFRVQYFPSQRFRTQLAGGNVDIAEDYSGQTFVLALHTGALPGIRGTTAEDWMRFLDLTVGFGTRGYKPDLPGAPEDRWQELQVGFALNVQGVFDATLGGRKSRAASITRQIGHGVFEVAQLPFTMVPVASSSRSPDH